MGILDVSSWEAPPLAEVAKVAPPYSREGRKASRWRSPAAPADVYCYLHARFGPPNGMMMLAAPPSSDNIFHWHFHLVSGDDQLHVHGVSARVDFLAFSAEKVTDQQWAQLLNDMKGDFASHGAQIRAVRQSLERWTVFVNPYFRLERIVAELHARLDDLDLSDDLPESPEREDDLASFQTFIDQLGQN